MVATGFHGSRLSGGALVTGHGAHHFAYVVRTPRNQMESLSTSLR